MILFKLEQLHRQMKQNRWLRYFTIFNRVALAAGFLPSGFVKIMGERFTNLSNNHPMGHYLEALHHTGYYYPFIGVVQMSAAFLLLIPRTATLGALLYFPIILNICILSLAVRFDGSLITAPLMVLSNFYLLCWDYDRIKHILPLKPTRMPYNEIKPEVINHRFPVAFFAGAFLLVVALVGVITNMYTIKPRNTLSDCMMQCKGSGKPDACVIFCNGIHKDGKPLDVSLDAYENAKPNTAGYKP